jgi:hypothetical protein
MMGYDAICHCCGVGSEYLTPADDLFDMSDCYEKKEGLDTFECPNCSMKKECQQRFEWTEEELQAEVLKDTERLRKEFERQKKHADRIKNSNEANE